MSKPLKILLIVVGVIFAFSLTLGLIAAVFVIPAMQRTIRRTNETSAIASLRALNSAEGQYSSTYPQHGFACSLSTLGGSPNSGAPSADSAQFINDDLASGMKSGYTFAITGCTKTTVNNVDQYTGYHITATPTSVGRSGDRGFCSDESSKIFYDPKGGNNCTEVLE